jgi:hypothetical protein
VPDSRKIIRVFLASPGDLSEERVTAKEVVDDFNNSWADVFGYHVELVGWEDTVSVFGRPQATINRDLARCGYFIGVLWKKWGTPPDVSGQYTSGFEEEFTISVTSRKKTGRPEISLLFKDVPNDQLQDPGDELRKVIAFRDKIIDEKQILFETFSDLRVFEKRLRRCIERFVQRLHTDQAQLEIEANQAPSSDDTPPRELSVPSHVDADSPLSREGVGFLRALLGKTERVDERDKIAAVEVARFRLLANVIKRTGNDESHLGAHDANLLFSNRARLKLGTPEMAALVQCGLENYSSENVPLWHWYAAIRGFERKLFSAWSFAATSSHARIGALNAMRLIAEPVRSTPHTKRENYIDAWFAQDAPSGLREAALTYLGDCGHASDLSVIKAELDRGDYQTTSAALDAYLRISLRDSKEKAISALYEFQQESIKQDLLDAIFQGSSSIPVNVLTPGVSHRSPAVRRIVVQLLDDRHALGADLAERLTADSDAIVRYTALQALIRAGRVFLDSEVKAILTKPSPSSRTTYGLLGQSDPDSAGKACWDQFVRERFRRMTDRELEQAAEADTIYNRSAQFALAQRQFAKRGDALRVQIADTFKAEFAAHLERIAKDYGPDSDLAKSTRNIDEFVRKGLTREALDVVCRAANPDDLHLVRTALKSEFVAYSDADVEYLRKFGEWEDVPLIIAEVQRPDYVRSTILGSRASDRRFRTAARAVYAMGRNRLSELLMIPGSGELISQLVLVAADENFRALDDEAINKLLLSEHDTVRKAAGLKCVRALPKKRLIKILNDYDSPDAYRYYNVIHWLDMGASAPSTLARKAAGKAIEITWNRL